MFHACHTYGKSYCISLNANECLNGDVHYYAHNWHEISHVDGNDECLDYAISYCVYGWCFNCVFFLFLTLSIDNNVLWIYQFNLLRGVVLSGRRVAIPLIMISMLACSHPVNW